MYGYIYETTNLVNGKKYIGKHVSENFVGIKYLGSGIYLKRAINKYGKENFKVRLIEKCETEVKLNERETYWIDKLNCIKSNDYYNIGAGGIGWNNSINALIGSDNYVNPFYGKHHTLEQRAKWSKERKNKKLSLEHRKKLSEAQKIAQLGNKKSDKTKNKISNSLKNSIYCKNRKWYNNGVVERLSQNPIPGFNLGRLSKNQPEETIRPEEIMYK